VHDPLNLDYQVRQGDHRPLTLVFAKERTPAAIKEALFQQRTAVYSGNQLIGDETFLRPIFMAAIKLLNPEIRIQGKGSVLLQIRNDSDVDFQLVRAGDLPEVTLPEKLTLAAQKTVLLQVKSKSDKLAGRRNLRLPYRVTNLLIAPATPLSASLLLDVTFVPTGKR
jgi:hypothetical protein